MLNDTGTYLPSNVLLIKAMNVVVLREHLLEIHFIKIQIVTNTKFFLIKNMDYYGRFIYATISSLVLNLYF